MYAPRRALSPATKWAKEARCIHRTGNKYQQNNNKVGYARDSQNNTHTKTIPGPAWIWTEPLNSYSRIHARRPHVVQFISTLIIYLVGDLTAQQLVPSSKGSEDTTQAYDPFRTARALVIGGLAAIPGYKWFVFLARHFNYSSKALSVVVKVLVNQILFTPVFNCYFFGMQSLLSGASLRDSLERIQHTVPTSLVNSWKIWPAITAFSFAFIRVELRGLFAGVIAIGWQTYLSLLNQRAEQMQLIKHQSSEGDKSNKPGG